MNLANLSIETQNNNIHRRASLVSNKILELIVLPTERCNFRCIYCYEDHQTGRMAQETVNGIKNLIYKRCEEKKEFKLFISWFGGEPLIAKDIVYDISGYATGLSRKYTNFYYEGSMTTNGYLLDIDTLNKLAESGVKRYQISLDGPHEIHDRSRRRADGKGTFDRIWSNLLAIRDSSLPVDVLLRLHFTPDSIKLLDTLIENIRKEFIQDKRFSFLFKPIGRFGGDNDESINIFTSQQELKDAIYSLGNKLFSGVTLPQIYNGNSEDNVCYASRPNSLVIRANGDVGKCTVALEDPRNKIGTLKPDGTLELIPGRLAPWVRGIQTLDPRDLSCPKSKLPSIK
ncbi:MAG: radical SAM protein [Prochloraceae cyanobacterium]